MATLRPSNQYLINWRRSSIAERLHRRNIVVRAENGNGESSPNKGWFYRKFVAEQTMDSKLNKLKSDVAARGGYVGTWFNDAFKYTAWIEIHRVLTERNLISIDCERAAKLSKNGNAILLDVRESQDFAKVHAQNSLNAPLFRLIQGFDLKSNVRRLGYALITNFAGTERNPDFIIQAMDAVNGNKKKKIIVLCSTGGSLLTYVERRGLKVKKFKDPERMFGRPSRSLRAIYELQQAGFSNVFHLKEGLNEWIHQDFPTTGLIE